jgi:hypothetical protein
MKRYIIILPALIYALNKLINRADYGLDLDFSSFIFGGILTIVVHDLLIHVLNKKD